MHHAYYIVLKNCDQQKTDLSKQKYLPMNFQFYIIRKCGFDRFLHEFIIAKMHSLQLNLFECGPSKIQNSSIF